MEWKNDKSSILSLQGSVAMHVRCGGKHEKVLLHCKFLVESSGKET